MLRTFRILTPPPTPLIDLALAKRHLRVDYDLEDDLIAAYLDAAISLAETYLDRSLITRQIGTIFSPTDLIPPVAGGSWFMTSGVPGYWSRHPDSYRLELPRGSVQEIEAVSLIRGVTESVLDADDYTATIRTDPAALMVHCQRPGDVISVVYTAGYGETPADVPAPIRAAVLLWTQHLHEHRGDTNEEQPAAIRNLLNPYRLVTFG